MERVALNEKQEGPGNCLAECLERTVHIPPSSFRSTQVNQLYLFLRGF